MNRITTVEGIGRRFRELVKHLDVHPCYKTFHTMPQHDGSPHIEQSGDEFDYVITERGSEYARFRTTDPDEILYKLVDSATQVAATNYELKHRIAGRDGREIWFPYQEDLLHAIKPEWGARKRDEHMRILINHPYK